MGLNIIPSNISSLAPEKRQIAQLIKEKYENNTSESFFYLNPKIKNLRPDFLLIVPQKGVALINILGLKISQISSINRKQISLTDGSTVDNPVFRSNQNFNLSKALFESDDRFYNSDGFLAIDIVSVVIFTNIKRVDITKNQAYFNQPPTKLIASDELPNFSESLIFDSKNMDLTDNHVNLIRTTLFPEIKIYDAIRKQEPNLMEFNPESAKKIILLDREQEAFAKRLPFGHYMVTGVPGSGKTVILLSRALFLVKENPEWQVLIVTYNRSLAKKLESRLNQFEEENEFMGINSKSITVKTFSRLALDIACIPVPHNSDDKFWIELLPQQALLKARPIYDAVLIDEYQDFYDDWIKVCIKLCKEFSYTNTSGQKVNGINLFLAGDRLQSIYNERELSWAQLGIDMRGRSKLLKKTYRTGKEHINLALDFLMAESTLTKEVEYFYEGRQGIENEAKITNRIEYIEGDYYSIANLIDNLILKAHFNPEHILILCPDNRSAERLRGTFNDKVKSKATVSKEIVDGMITITTYFPSKGLESMICILVDTHKFPLDFLNRNEILQRKLFYVGMTRASQYLYIHANEFTPQSYGGIVKSGNFR